jgi:glycine betaine/choline ABC-type transport system substrate-binding protein
MSRSLGFSDTYALGMTPQRAERLGITKVSEPESLLIWPGFWGVTGGFTG